MFESIDRMKEHGSIPPEMLPTTPELAREGAELFQKVLAGTNSESVKDALIKHKKIQQCFLGITPQIYLDENDTVSALSPADYNEFGRVMLEYAPGITPVILETQNDTGDKQITASLLNLKAAIHVMHSNPEMFPAVAFEQPEVWLVNNPQEWQTADGISEPLRRQKLFCGYPYWTIVKTPESDKMLDTLAVPGSFLGEINPQRDEAFLTEIQKIYAQSGIQLTIEKQHKETWGRKLWQKIKNK